MAAIGRLTYAHDDLRCLDVLIVQSNRTCTPMHYLLNWDFTLPAILEHHGIQSVRVTPKHSQCDVPCEDSDAATLAIRVVAAAVDVPFGMTKRPAAPNHSPYIQVLQLSGDEEGVHSALRTNPLNAHARAQMLACRQAAHRD